MHDWKLPSLIKEIIDTLYQAGGRPLLVGGCVRDYLLRRPIKDYDLEVYGLEQETLKGLLSQFGEVLLAGQSFGVLKIRTKSLTHDLDISLPRRDNKIRAGHQGFSIETDPHLSFEEAFRRRDVTINSIGYDLKAQTFIDPYKGISDLERKILRATSEMHFPEDPLRGLRVAQFAARFSMRPDEKLIHLSRKLDLSELAGERIYQEFYKLLIKGEEPSRGLNFLKEANLIRFFPPLAALVNTPQDPHWHPEGDVWTHTLMVVDQAAKLREGDQETNEVLMFGTLCHDFGKPASTYREENGRLRSPGHDVKGVPIAETFLKEMKAPKRLLSQVLALVRYHLYPLQFIKQKAGPAAFRRLAQKLASENINLRLLALVARADHLGRTTENALKALCPEVDTFEERAKESGVYEKKEEDVVLGRHLIAKGLTPGVLFKDILVACRHYQEETNCRELEAILSHVLQQFP